MAFRGCRLWLPALLLAAACDSSPLDAGPAGAAGASAAGSAGTAGVGGSAGSSAAGNAGNSGASAGDAGGSGTAGGSGSGGEAGASDCDDADPATEDFSKPAYGCGHLRDSDPNDGSSWIDFDSGFSVDPKTGYGWIDLTRSGGSLSLMGAEGACENFSVASLGDWRVPTIDEARTLAAGCAATSTGGSCPLADPDCLDQTCGYGSGTECESCQAGKGPGPAGAYCNPDAAICAFFHTSSLCSDCTSAQDWQYGPSNGNYAPADVTNLLTAVCVTTSVPDATP